MYNTRLGLLGNCPDDEILMYDFAAKTGDPLPGAQENEGVFKEMDFFTVHCLNDTVLGGEKRRMYTAGYVTPNGDCYSHADDIKLIEGLGTTAGWLASHHVIIRAGVDYNYSLTPGKPGYKSRLVAVYNNNGDFIYGDEESYNALLNRIKRCQRHHGEWRCHRARLLQSARAADICAGKRTAMHRTPRRHFT